MKKNDRIYDLRSDTFTLPTPEMREAIARAEVGDDVFGEDPTVNRLEKRAAALTGKEAALFVSSGTMGNLLAFMIHGGQGKEILLHEKAHALHYELTGMSALAGAMPIALPGERGILSPETVKAAIRKGKPYYMAATGLIEIENSHNFAGGSCYRPEEIRALGELAQEEGLPLHMDGARLFNAAAAVDAPPQELCEPVTTVTFCLSKGLGAPMGSLLCGPKEFVSRARTLRKMLGGGMRQIGFMAAAGLYALENYVDRLREDNENAAALARTLNEECPWAEIDPGSVETNIVFFDTPNHEAEIVRSKLEDKGVLAIATGSRTIRFVTSREVPGTKISEVCEILCTLKV